MQAKVLKSELHLWIWIQVPPAKSAMEQPQAQQKRRDSRHVEFGPENQEFLVWWTEVFILGMKRGQGHPKSIQNQIFLDQCWNDASLVLARQHCRKEALLWLHQCQRLRCNVAGASLFSRIWLFFWLIAAVWVCKFARVVFDFLHVLPRHLEQCVVHSELQDYRRKQKEVSQHVNSIQFPILVQWQCTR